MNLQILQDSNGNNTGVYIPPKDWELIKMKYPDIEEITEDIPDWQKEIIAERLEMISKNPERLKPIGKLIEVLNRKMKPWLNLSLKWSTLIR